MSEPLVVPGRRAALEAVRSGAAREVFVAEGASRTPAVRELLEAAGSARLTVTEVPSAWLDGVAPDHHGVAVRVRPPEAIGERELAARAFEEDALVVVLDGITDPQNLGAAARSSEAAGAVMLVTRTRRAADATPAAIRASAGALLHLPLARVANIPKALQRLQGNGFTVVGLSEDAERTVFEEPAPSGRVAIVLGDEGVGLARLTRETCDVLVRLPMLGRVGSLNASASLAAALYAFVLPSRTDRRA